MWVSTEDFTIRYRSLRWWSSSFTKMERNPYLVGLHHHLHPTRGRAPRSIEATAINREAIDRRPVGEVLEDVVVLSSAIVCGHGGG